MDIPSTITSSLLEGIRLNQQDAWNRMVKLYYLLVYSWCRKAGLKPEDSSDISQNVFNGVSQGIRNFTREKPADTFTGWLRTITKRRIFDFRKKTSNQPLIYEGDIHSIPDFIEEEILLESSNQDYLILLRGVLEIIKKEFEENTWNIFWRHVVEEIPLEDVTKEFNVNANSVYLAKSRVLKKLRSHLNPPA